MYYKGEGVTKDLQKAAECLQLARRAHALLAERNNRAIAFLELGKEAEARAELRAAMASDPQWAPPHYNQSLLEWRSGERPLELVRDLRHERELARVPRALLALAVGEDLRLVPLAQVVHALVHDRVAGARAVAERVLGRAAVVGRPVGEEHFAPRRLGADELDQLDERPPFGLLALLLRVPRDAVGGRNSSSTTLPASPASPLPAAAEEEGSLAARLLARASSILRRSLYSFCTSLSSAMAVEESGSGPCFSPRRSQHAVSEDVSRRP